MRLLHRGHDHDLRLAEPGPTRRSRRGAEGQYLPLHRLSLDRGRAQRQDQCRRCRRRRCVRPQPAGAGRAATWCAGAARYTLDIAIDGLLHIKMLRSPHAACQNRCDRQQRGLAVPGVHAVLTHEDAPRRLFSTARHEKRLDGPRRHPRARPCRALHRPEVAAVVAESEGAAEEGCRRSRSTYEILPQ